MGRALPSPGLPPAHRRASALLPARPTWAPARLPAVRLRHPQLECRDTWIGWQGQAHRKHLDLVISNSRFLLFPWVQVKFLASKALGLALQQLPQDWQQRHGYRPVLVETFVDLERYRATCYRAANWQFLGMTKGRKARGTAPAKTPKGVYVYPLHPDWRTILLHGPGAAARPGPLAKPGVPRHLAPAGGAAGRSSRRRRWIAAAAAAGLAAARLPAAGGDLRFAANWQFLGMTKGRKARGTAPAKTPKGVYVYPVHPDWRTILLHGPGAAARPGPLAKPASWCRRRRPRIALECLRSFGLSGLWQLWQSSGPGIRVGATGACGGRISHQ